MNMKIALISLMILCSIVQIPSVGAAAPAYDNSAGSNKTNASFLLITLNISVSANFVLIFSFAGNGASQSAVTITSVKVGAASAVLYRADAGSIVQERFEIWFLANPPVGVSTIKLNYNSTVPYVVAIAESFSGIATATPFESSQAFSILTTYYSKVVTTVNTNDIMATFLGILDFNDHITSITGFVETQRIVNSTGIEGEGGFRPLPTAGTYGVTWLLSASENSGGDIVVLRGSSPRSSIVINIVGTALPLLVLSAFMVFAIKQRGSKSSVLFLIFALFIIALLMPSIMTAIWGT